MKSYKPKFVVGAKVQIYPGDHYTKYAKILEIDERGHTFELTETNDPNLKPGDFLFWSHSSPLKLKLIQ